jgi:hypothetical protein
VDPASAAAAGPPLEVLDDVGDEHLRAVDAGLLETFVEQPAGGADERMTLDVFAVSRLLPDEQQLGRYGSGAENRLGRPFPERTRTTVTSVSADRGERSGSVLPGYGRGHIRGCSPIRRASITGW